MRVYTINEIDCLSDKKYNKLSKRFNSLPVSTLCRILSKDESDDSLVSSAFRNLIYGMDLYHSIEVDSGTNFYILSNSEDELMYDFEVLIKGLAGREHNHGYIFVIPTSKSMNRLLNHGYII